MVRIVKQCCYKVAIGFLLRICDVTVMHRACLLFWPASYSRSMAASSLVDFVFRAKGIAFYGSNMCYMYLEPHNRFNSNFVAWMLLSGHQKLGHKQPSFWLLFSGQEYKRTGKPLRLAFFTSTKLPLACCLKLLISFACRYGRYVRVRDY